MTHIAAPGPSRTRHRILAILLALVGALTMTATPAKAGPLDTFDVDFDTVDLGTPTSGWLQGGATFYHKSGGIQLQLIGTLIRTSSSVVPCILSRTIVSYAYGSPSTHDSTPICIGDAQQSRSVHVDTSANRDVVSIAVQVRMSPARYTVSVPADGSTYIVGQAPYSLGTAERLDWDPLSVGPANQKIFSGSSWYAVERRIVDPFEGWTGIIRSTVDGTLNWQSGWTTTPGTQARAKVTWTYSDKSTSSSMSDTIYRGGGPVKVHAQSSPMKDVHLVRVEIISGDGVRLYGVQGASEIRRFGTTWLL